MNWGTTDFYAQFQNCHGTCGCVVYHDRLEVYWQSIFHHLGPIWSNQLMAYPVLNGSAILLMVVPCLLPVSEL